ncbi:hypothetical protein [Fundidesulfovibrio agrisoli]|uniref:hypothetical protein n=1 Tax=Fundidesulfovibrio agrisoli TaxID=2922717 RepID=UPI001FAD3E43|nr:hypothetical protein [Fundidesulfovibrio agrisoli]
MAKENVRKVMGVTAAVFAQMGVISREEALELSGMEPAAFDEAMSKATKAADEVRPGHPEKEPSFYDVVSKAAEEYLDAINKK